MTAGEQGPQGEQGLRGEIGKLGLKGNQGNRGNPGAKGETGKSGSDPTKRLRIMGAFVVAVFVLLSVRTEIATDRIEDNAAEIAEVQARTSDEVLCPLYELLLNAVKHPVKERTDTAAERKTYAGYVALFQNGYDTLGCKP